MMRTARLTVSLLAAGAALAGCLGAPAPPARLYTLRVTPPAEVAVAAAAEAFVSVGPVTLPAAVDRPQIVVSEGESRVRLLESDRWAEPLRGAIARLLAEEIGRHLPRARVSAQGESGETMPTARVLVDVRAFDSRPGEEIVLDAVWLIRRGDALERGRSRLREPVAADGIEPLVQAHARALAALGAEIASRLRAP